MKQADIILGAGITGLSAGFERQIDIFEATGFAGGICRSYYATRRGKILPARTDKETYRFEQGGGHWIFGTKSRSLQWIRQRCRVRWHNRRAQVFLPRHNLTVPFPLQNNLRFLPGEIKEKILKEIRAKRKTKTATLADWLMSHFGETLCDIFFFPFHERYTNGLFHDVAPEDLYKTPCNKQTILAGAQRAIPPSGYNDRFIYPEDGLDTLVRGLAGGCSINYNKKAVKIKLKTKEVFFKDGSSVPFHRIFSTLPLSQVVTMAGLDTGEPDPHTSVLVLNLGATKGPRCPDAHWVFVPQSKSGFHRIGFYSQVTPSFLPASLRKNRDAVSLYVEKSFPGNRQPTKQQLKKTTENIITELKEWGIISEVEVCSPTWIPVAYTWRKPGSRWAEDSIKTLARHGIIPIGRYGRWRFQGIAQSMEEGHSILL